MSSSTHFSFASGTAPYPPVKPPWLRPVVTAIVIAVHAFVAWVTLVTSVQLFHAIDVTLVPSGDPLGWQEQEADDQPPPPEEVELPDLAMPAPLILSPDAPVKEEIVKPKTHVVPKRERPRSGRIPNGARRGAARLACPRDERRRAAAWTTPRCSPSRSGDTRRPRRPSAPERRASNFTSTPTARLSESPPRDPVRRMQRSRVALSHPFMRHRRRAVPSSASRILYLTDQIGSSRQLPEVVIRGRAHKRVAIQFNSAAL